MKNQSVIAISLLSVGVGLAFGYALWGDGGRVVDKSELTMGVTAGTHRMPDGSMMHNGDTMGGMNNQGHMMTMTVSSEREFLSEMIPHHQEAVDTAKEVIARGGTTPAIKQLVENIVVAQEKEIADMKAWYETWYQEPYVAVAQGEGEYVAMMRGLSTLSGEELDRIFLEDMVMHHMGAIMMARSVVPYIEHQEIEELTEAIVSSQSTEIMQMRQMLQSL